MDIMIFQKNELFWGDVLGVDWLEVNRNDISNKFTYINMKTLACNAQNQGGFHP